MNIDNISTLLDVVQSEAVLKVGQRVEINDFMAPQNEEDEESDIKTYSSRIEDIREGKMYLAMPLDDKLRPIIPPAGKMIEGRVFNNKIGYSFRAVYEQIKNIPLPTWVVQIPPTMIKCQERRFVRVTINLPIRVNISNPDGSIGKVYRTHTIDISGNGLAFLVSENIPVRTKLIIETDLIPSVGIISTFAVVRRCIVQKNKLNYLVGVEFVDFSRQTQNKLIRYLFTKQRQLLNKGIMVK